MNQAISDLHRPLGAGCKFGIMRNHDCGQPVLAERTQKRIDLVTVFAVKVAGRFIRQQNLGIVQAIRAMAVRCISPPLS